ncbi:MAG: hypothetical protein JRJ56_02720 [Deltaproteobacteria bacterium]|nr:hypothetical protein [Deltaproteobacteria bacterium]
MKKANHAARRLLPAMALIILWLAAACGHRQPQPPPAAGTILARGGHDGHVLNIRYTVGRLDNRLAVVGTITNEYVAGLENLVLELTVADPAGKQLAKAAAGPFDLTANGRQVFSLNLPLLHGHLDFNFRYDYDYNDYGMSRYRVHGPTANDWSYFSNRLVLP